MDYDLSRLSSRSFEQLVQALSERKLGPGTIVFGDGPDGGREAALRGATAFAPHGSAWDGDIVVQAKFRQRPLGTTIDGPWAVAELKDELEKFATRKGDRARPEYYIFATNAVLSPGTGGTKDQAIEALDAACSWGLREYDIWDYDKLRTFLDNDREVRTRWGWITAGDVLAAMLRQLEGASPDFERTIANYLEKTLIGDRFLRLEEAGHASEDATPLSRVFVDLPLVAGGDEQSLFLRELLWRTAIRAQPAGHAPVEAERLVLVGGPGQGKTTLGQFACQIFRASLLDSGSGRPLSPEGRDAVNAIRIACQDADLEFGRAPRFPVRVVLTDLAKWLQDGERPLLAYIGDQIEARVGTRVAADTFRAWLGAYPWFLVLDGLDEVPANAGREAVMRCITEFFVDVAQEQADVVVLATTRPQGYNKEFSPDRFRHLQLAELSTQQALDYGNRLAGARYGETDRGTLVRERLSRAAGSPATAHLMRSPLQVAIMTALVDRFGQPPQERWGLFHAYYRVIFQRERERDTSAASVLRDYEADIDAIHQRVGLALQVLTTHAGHADPRLSGSQLMQIVEQRLDEEGHSEEQRTAIATEIKRAAELRLVFLVGAEEDRIGFEIRSLQEFMAAGALVDGRDELVIERLRVIAPLPSWRNVMLFAAGQCFRERRHLRTEITSLCRELDVAADDPLLVESRVGARLALDLLEDGVARHQPALQRVLAKHAMEVLELADPVLPLRLARCHEPAVDELFRQQLTDRLRDGNATAATAARRCLAGLASEEVTWAASVLAEHPPMTSEDTIRLLANLPAPVVDRLDHRMVASWVGTLDPRGFSQLAVDAGISRLSRATRFATADDALQLDVSVGIEGLGFQLVSVQPRLDLTKDRWTPNQARAIPESPTMAAYNAVADFGRSPSTEALGVALETIAATSTSEVWRSVGYNAPWPLGRHLVDARDAAHLRTVAQEVREGRHGDQRQWEDAERRWSAGVELARDALDPRMPFPLECVTVVHRRTIEEEPTIVLLDAWRALRAHGHPATSNLARALLWRLGLVGANPSRPERLGNVVELMKAAGDSREDRRYFEIGLLDVQHDGPRDLAAVLDAMGDRLGFWYRPRDWRLEGVVIAELTELAEAGHRRAIEALAFAFASTVPRELRAVPLGLDHDDPLTRAYAAYITFVSGPSEASPEELGRIVGATGQRPVASLLASPITQGADGWEDFLVGFRRSQPPGLQEETYVETLLGEALSLRVTPLAYYGLWRELELFEPHPMSLMADATARERV